MSGVNRPEHPMAGCRGMMLLELMLATAILGIALVTLAIAIGRCVHGMAAAEEVDAAVRIAENRLAEWKIGTVGRGEIRPGVWNGARTVGPRRFEWRQNVAVTAEPGVYESTLVVRWGQGAHPQERRFVWLDVQSPSPVSPTVGPL